MTSPLITSDLPIVAWSEVVPVVEAGRGTAAGSLALIMGEGVAMDDDGLPVDVLGRSGSFGRPGVAG